MKKNIIILLVFVLCVILVSGCSKKVNKKDETSKDTNINEPVKNQDNNKDSQSDEDHTLKNIIFELISSKSDEEEVNLKVKVKNVSNDVYQNTQVKITLLDDNGKEVTSFIENIDEMNLNEEKILELNAKKDARKATKINYEIIK